MPRIGFDQELRKLQDQILGLGSEVEENLVKVVDALRQRDVIQARRLIQADVAINERRIQIGMGAMTLIATQQPMARDMRTIAAVLEIVGELERIHDYVKGIGKITLMLNENGGPAGELLRNMPEMAQQTARMLHKALTAFAERSADIAREVPRDDTIVDNLYKQVYREIIDYVTHNPQEIERANLLEWVAHNLERAADRTTNICEWVVYMIDGTYVEMDSEVEAPPELRP
ncbi:MAG: phosphate signaling complex protein PhoU [Ardenticatenaceae bacterium]|nr:phosphate signaling complex protein PhoU [Ardenticatenaceae bacterium]